MSEFKSFLTKTNRKFNTWCNYTTRLDTYGRGCQHDCDYCYAKSLLEFRNMWGVPAVANVYKIENRIKNLPVNSVVKLGGMTDCFQPIEMEKRITYETIKILNRCGVNYLIVTKSHLVTHPAYLKIYDGRLAHFQITITNTNDRDNLKYEKASLPSKRIKSIELLYKMGFDVSVRLSPFIREHINVDVLNEIRCDKILVEFLKVNHRIKKTFDIDYSKYTLSFGGYKHLELETKKKLLSEITGFNQVSVGEYVKEHYEYFRQHVNFNKLDCCNVNLNFPQVNMFETKQG